MSIKEIKSLIKFCSERKLNDMKQLKITENEKNESNLLYIQSTISEFCTYAGCTIKHINNNGRVELLFNFSECYGDLIKAEIFDKVAEIIAIKYKYDYFKKNVKVGGLNSVEKEILLASLIAADLDDDKRYSLERLKIYEDLAIDGIYNFRLKPLKKKWQDVSECVPSCFLQSQLKEFISYLLEGKSKRIYVENGRVYDVHCRRLKRGVLVGGDDAKILIEVLLGNGGEVELNGTISTQEEYYLKEFFNRRIIFKRNDGESKYLN